MKMFASIMTNAICLLEIDIEDDMNYGQVLNRLEGDEELCRQIVDEISKNINIDNLTVEAIQHPWKPQEGDTIIKVGRL